MCQHRQAVPHVETGIERHWREEREREEYERRRRLAELLRPMSQEAINTHPLLGYSGAVQSLQAMPSGYCHSPLLDAMFDWWY